MNAVSQPRLPSKDAIVAALRPADVLQHFGLEGRRSGSEFRTRLCPACGARNRDSVVINLESGRWYDHAHQCHGDLLGLVAGYAGLDVRTEFVQVLDLAARIGGIDIDIAQHARARTIEPFQPPAQSLAPARTYPEHEHESERALARHRAPAVWDHLKRSSLAGRGYLRERALGDLQERDDLVRFSPLEVTPKTEWGQRVARLLGTPAVCVPVHDLDDGTIVNVVARRLEPKGKQPKVVSLPGCPKVSQGRLAGAFGRWSEFQQNARDVVLVEGVFDYLSALVLWPDFLVLGADGAGLLRHVARTVAPVLVAAGRRLLVVPHADPAGADAAANAGAEAIAAGMRVDDNLVAISLRGHADLNDAHRAGEPPNVR